MVVDTSCSVRWLPCNDYSPWVSVAVVGATSTVKADHEKQTAGDYTNDSTSAEVSTISCTIAITIAAFANTTVRVVTAKTVTV